MEPHRKLWKHSEYYRDTQEIIGANWRLWEHKGEYRDRPGLSGLTEDYGGTQKMMGTHRRLWNTQVNMGAHKILWDYAGCYGTTYLGKTEN